MSTTLTTQHAPTTTPTPPSTDAAGEPYLPPKLPCQMALDIIMQQIHERLLRHEAFSNPSVVYFAVGYDFRVELDLYGREVTKAGLKGAYRVPYDNEGRPIALPVEQGLPTHARVERKGQLGKDKPRLATGSHVVVRGGTSPEQSAIEKEQRDRDSLAPAGVPAGSLGAPAAQAPKE